MIEVQQVTKVYRRGHSEVNALAGVSLQVPQGQFLSVMGPSGSGKSTLLHLLGALDTPTTGTLKIEGVDISRMPDDQLSKFRRERLGFVFQFFNLLPTLTALENVLLPVLLSGKSRSDIEGEGRSLLTSVGLAGRQDHTPDEMSGGEMQRVAVARALMSRPALLLADEPTGNLDSKAGTDILRILRTTARERNVTVVMVTHDPAASLVGERIVRLADGRIVGDEQVQQPAA